MFSPLLYHDFFSWGCSSKKWQSFTNSRKYELSLSILEKGGVVKSVSVEGLDLPRYLSWCPHPSASHQTYADVLWSDDDFIWHQYWSLITANIRVELLCSIMIKCPSYLQLSWWKKLSFNTAFIMSFSGFSPDIARNLALILYADTVCIK